MSVAVRCWRLHAVASFDKFTSNSRLWLERFSWESRTSSLSSHASSGIDTSNNAFQVKITEFDPAGNHTSSVVRKSDLLQRLSIQPRDIRFSTATSLYQRGTSIILRLQEVKAIIRSDSLILLDSDHHAIQDLLPELETKLQQLYRDPLPFEFRALEALLMKMFTVLDERLSKLEPALRDVLNTLLDPGLVSVDRGQLHFLLHHSKNLSEFDSLVRDIESTLTEVLDSEQDMSDMYLTHWAETGEERDEEDIEDIYNILEAFALQAENLLSEIQKLRESIDQSESIILINLDSQRNVMLRLSLQLEMGTFSAALSGFIGLAFGMNLNSSLEDNVYTFWVLSGLMLAMCGLFWRRLLLFLGKNLDRSQVHKITKKSTKYSS